MERIYLATDHAGFKHKEAVLQWLSKEGYEVVDCGAYEYNKEDDFTDFVNEAAKAVSKDQSAKAIIFGGSGNGEAMMANRYDYVRAAVYYGGPKEIVELSRVHNNANILSIGARFVGVNETKEVVWSWLHATESVNEKYHRRNRELDSLSYPISYRINEWLKKVTHILQREI